MHRMCWSCEIHFSTHFALPSLDTILPCPFWLSLELLRFNDMFCNYHLSIFHIGRDVVLYQGPKLLELEQLEGDPWPTKWIHEISRYQRTKSFKNIIFLSNVKEYIADESSDEWIDFRDFVDVFLELWLSGPNEFSLWNELSIVKIVLIPIFICHEKPKDLNCKWQQIVMKQ